MPTLEEMKQNRAGWVADLLSGIYPQAKNSLRTTLGFCCLGLMCNRINPNGWCGADVWTSYRWIDPEGTAVAILIDYPSDSVLELFGITHDDATKLADLNDAGYTFGEIAFKVERLPFIDSHGRNMEETA